MLLYIIDKTFEFLPRSNVRDRKKSISFIKKKEEEKNYKKVAFDDHIFLRTYILTKYII